MLWKRPRLTLDMIKFEHSVFALPFALTGALLAWRNAGFPAEGAAPYRRDLKNVETHLLDTGHFALETHNEEIAGRIEDFLRKQKIAR